MKDQCYEMAMKLAELRKVLDVYRGLFERPDDAKVIAGPFPEIADVVRKSLSVYLISGCAAIFTDSDRTSGKENMSFRNLIQRFASTLSAEAHTHWARIEAVSAGMNLKEFRHKYVGHFGLQEHLTEGPMLKAAITSDKLHELLVAGESLINLILRPPSDDEPRNLFAFYQPIHPSQSAEQFLLRLSRT